MDTKQLKGMTAVATHAFLGLCTKYRNSKKMNKQQMIQKQEQTIQKFKIQGTNMKAFLSEVQG